MSNELLYQVALSLVPQIGDVHAKTLIGFYGSASAVFKAKKRELEKIEGIGSIRAGFIKGFSDFSGCEEEIEFIQKNGITPLFMSDEDYPSRLLHCYDAPCLLYYKGNANLNSPKVIAVIGTRNNDEYGRKTCTELIESLNQKDILIISGLAFGIDTIAHKAALKQGLPTIGVLAHGLDRIYPYQNHHLAEQMLEQGGLLTEFRSNTNPDKQNFPRRNRIVAGLCDCLLVIQSSSKGGSMITAELANSYNRDVFAIPGRCTDARSEGCHYLVKSNKASLVTTADDILNNMGWKETKKKSKVQQRDLFDTFSIEEKLIIETLEKHDTIHIDIIQYQSGLGSTAIAGALLSLEMQGTIQSLPGKMYRLC